MKAKKTKEAVINITQVPTQVMTVTIEGDGDLVLNRMNKRNREDQINKQNNRKKEVREPNMWEDYITALHWRDDLPTDIQYTEETFHNLLKDNCPCISAYGLKSSFADAVYRNGIDKNKTKLMASINIIAPNNLIPISYAEHHMDEKLMKPPVGSIVLSRQNRFSGWSAKFMVQYIEGGAYSAEQIVQAIQLAGFGIGIGSGRNTGYGRYHITNIE